MNSLSTKDGQTIVSKTAVIFPGQGAQQVGMCKDLYQSSQAARDVFTKAADILGMDLTKLVFEGPAEKLDTTEWSQPAIFVTSVAAWQALQAAGIAQDLAPQAMAGLSLGEYTALHVAGWIAFEDALRLVAERGRLMQAAAEASSGGMVSIMGLDEANTSRLCQEAAQNEVLTPANFNCPGQIVVSGSKSACERALGLADKYSARAIPLNVAGAFHSALMGPAVDGLEKMLETTKITPGEIPVVANVSAGYYGGPDSIRASLREQVAKPIRWQASMERLVADGFGRFAEVGPGRVLTGLMRKINRSVTAENYSTAAAIERVSA